MRADFDLYVPGRSLLHRLDPRAKLLLAAELSLILFLLPRLEVVLGILALTQVLLLTARIPWSRLVMVWRSMLPLVLLVFVLWVLLQPGSDQTLFQAWRVRITMGGINLAAMMALRLIALAFTIFLWLFTTDQNAMVRGFVGLGLPYEWGLVLALALRYLPVFAGLYAQISDAQRARGLDLEKGNFLQRLQARQPILIAVIISALRTGQALGWALEARALGAALPPGVHRTTWRPLRFSREDWLVVVLLLVVGAFVVTLRVAGFALLGASCFNGRLWMGLGALGYVR